MRTARAIAASRSPLTVPQSFAWDELGVELAAQSLGLSSRTGRRPVGVPPNAESRVARIVRVIDREPTIALTLSALAKSAGLSPYHFLRVFEQVTGVTPHQYVRRVRLRAAAPLRVRRDPATVPKRYASTLAVP